MTGLVRLERHDAVCTLCVDNPPVNALGYQTFVDLDAALTEIEKDDGVRAVVLTGAGDKAFLAGADLTEFGELIAEPAKMAERAKWSRGIFHRIEELPMPVIAAVQASAVGGGAEVALLCDLVIADPRARFGLPEVQLGLIPGAGGTQRLPRRVGASRAKELIFLGETITAEEAFRIGLVNRIAQPGAAFEEATALAERIAARPARAVQHAKRAIDEGIGQPPDFALDLEHDYFMATLRTADAQEGYRAFLEKRQPNLTHR